MQDSIIVEETEQKIPANMAICRIGALEMNPGNHGYPANGAV